MQNIKDMKTTTEGAKIPYNAETVNYIIMILRNDIDLATNLSNTAKELAIKGETPDPDNFAKSETVRKIANAAKRSAIKSAAWLKAPTAVDMAEVRHNIAEAIADGVTEYTERMKITALISGQITAAVKDRKKYVLKSKLYNYRIVVQLDYFRKDRYNIIIDNYEHLDRSYNLRTIQETAEIVYNFFRHNSGERNEQTGAPIYSIL